MGREADAWSHPAETRTVKPTCSISGRWGRGQGHGRAGSMLTAGPARVPDASTQAEQPLQSHPLLPAFLPLPNHSSNLSSFTSASYASHRALCPTRHYVEAIITEATVDRDHSAAGPDLSSRGNPLRRYYYPPPLIDEETEALVRLHTLTKVTQVQKPEIKPKQSGLRVCDPKRQRKRGQGGEKGVVQTGKWE